MEMCIRDRGKGINEAGSGYDEQNPYAGRDPRFELTIAKNEMCTRDRHHLAAHHASIIIVRARGESKDTQKD